MRVGRYLEGFRVFVNLARGLVVIERVPEDEAQVLVNIERVLV